MRTTTWENIGTSVRGEKKIEDVLTAAGLNYTVEKRPVYRYERNPRKLVRISNRFTCEQDLEQVHLRATGGRSFV